MPPVALGEYAPTQQQRMAAFLAMGAIGGAFLVYQGWRHFFVTGVTSEEKRNILLFAASMGLWYGLDRAFELQKQLDAWQAQLAQQIGLQTQ